MVEALKKDKFLSVLPKEEIEMGEVDITDYPLDRPDPKLRHQLRVFYYERNGYVLSEKKLDNAYRFIRPVFDTRKQRYNICWADFVLLLEDTVVTKVYLTEAV